MKENFNLLEEIIDKEIDAYESIEGLCIQKKELLKTNKAEELYDIDSKILNKFESIKSFAESRKKISNKISGSDMNLSEIIRKTLEIDIEQSKRFEEKKKKLNAIEKTIRKTESINLNLIKHGLNMVGKILQIIFDNINITKNEYDKNGKIVDQEDLQLSSVNEEA